VQHREAKNLSTCELLALCAKDLQDESLWNEFYSRTQRRVITYLLRAFRTFGGRSEDFTKYADDWVQEVFIKLIQSDGRVIRSFRGLNDNSVYAFLASIAMSTVADQLRSQRATRRRGNVVPFDEVPDLPTRAYESDSRVTALLELIDIENALREDQESKNPERDLLIFKLHFVEGLTAREIASISTFKLTTSGLEKVLNRLRRRVTGKSES